MNDDDRQAFAGEMLRLGEVYEQEVSEARAEAYFEALIAFGITEISLAVRRAIKAYKFFPKPVELIDEIRAVRRSIAAEQRMLEAAVELTEDEQREADAAKAEFFKTVGVAIARLFGGPKTLAPLTDADLTSHEIRKKEAVERFYRALQERGR